MTPKIVIRVLLLLGALIFQSGCASWQVNQLATNLTRAGPQATLDHLQQISPSNRDRAQYLLNRGMLKFYLGEFGASRQDLEQAKSIMTSLQAASVSENLAAVSVNEALRAYSGSASDQVLVHLLLSLNYLFSGDADGARVEMLQANVTMQRLDDGKTDQGQLAGAQYVAGAIYEMNGEYDDAYISYRRAYNILNERKDPIPGALKTTLLNLGKRQGRDEDYREYSARFGASATPLAKGEVEWLLFYLDGVVSTKTDSRISVYSDRARSMVSVVMPRYNPSNYRARFISLAANGQTQRTDIIENLEDRAREDLKNDSAKMLAAATLRAVAKYNMVQEAQDKGDAAGILMNVLSVASEQADLRSWNMLPASIQVARIRVSAATRVQLPELGVTLPAADTLAAKQLAAVMANSLNDDYFTYPVMTPTSVPPSEQGEFNGSSNTP
ncbi:hypothetical protein FT643_18285 [Ketobacter sp. MCCC 1A13808]|uniref:COG3014 family protein n=1 Tax=Ketobacter sp. MCCC 1A13808 TaxID=2602738 RepID=UPI0012EB5E62|nr:hypothetical protein [Ketobacter sp. MCCC 1A13808]MVF14089.1 hypothetical protein [Ketobacter sp. MCCC 1A13808]